MKLKHITSLTIMLAFLVMVLTGIVLYIVPQGRVAYWADWQLLGLSKTQWGNVHVTMGLLMLLSGVLHIYYNWRPILSYLKNAARKVRVFTPDFNVALLVTVLFAGLTLFELPPIFWVLDASASIKDRAAHIYGEPPYGHAEESPLDVFTKRMGLDLEASLEALRESGLAVEGPRETLRTIANRNRLTPQQVYETMKAGLLGDPPEEPIGSPVPTRLGRKTLAEVSALLGLKTGRAVAILRRHGISGGPDDRLKDLAESNSKTPVELYELLQD